MYDQIRPVYQAIEFIESHLQEEINLAQIAEAAGYSLFYFIRRFNQAVHHTPYDYLIRRRLSEAARNLAQSDRRIIDIAQDYCFKDQETFSRVFRKMFGVPPSQWRKERRLSPHELMPALNIADLRFIERRIVPPPKTVEREELRLCGLMTALEPDTDAQSRQRKRVIENLQQSCGLQPNSGIIEVYSSCDRDWNNLYYFIGVEEGKLKSAPASIVVQSLPAALYATLSTLEKELPQALRYLYSTWLPKNGLTSAKNTEIILSPVGEDAAPHLKTILIPIKKR